MNVVFENDEFCAGGAGAIAGELRADLLPPCRELIVLGRGDLISPGRELYGWV